MAKPHPDRERALERLTEVAAVLERPDVTMRRMFGSEGLAVRGKLFAFASTAGDLVVKLPEQRIGELGLDPMVMRGRPMREWAVVPYDAGEERWRTIAGEAYAFVDSISP
ncbi:hypothetical protein AVP42_00821 [Agromyces sp. NDB4Y10]|uniref:TfoX/Sxy family protein n=1 Tax=Agromyces sp. NDB4Y10 TaxID=1775951 RepID=UPI0007B2EA77|nr:TfoX/Sxy family protein [Agromyces sp. NDB4Y10]KZE94893.1 hypothetical protein AVP42_00821 [Agromyces sp. NDB4Y10]